MSDNSTASPTANQGAPAQAAVKSGAFGQLNSGSFDVWATVGGPRGMMETTLPGLVFVVAYVATSNLKTTLLAACAVALVLIGWRLVTRQPLTYSVSGFIGVGIGVVWALLSGQGRDFYTLGLLAAAGYLLALLITLALRAPAVSMILTLVWQLPWRWWREGEHRALARSARRLTWLWAGLFALRLVVLSPLWWANQVAWLGSAKLLLGLPPFILCAWITWVILRSRRPQVEEQTPPEPAR